LYAPGCFPTNVIVPVFTLTVIVAICPSSEIRAPGTSFAATLKSSARVAAVAG